MFPLVSQYLRFLDQFPSLKSLSVSRFPGDFLTPQRIALLSSADSLSISDLGLPNILL